MLIGEFSHTTGEGGREEHAESLLRIRHASQQEADIFDKTEIEHAIGLIHHYHLNRPQIVDPLFVVVDQSPWGAD